MSTAIVPRSATARREPRTTRYASATSSGARVSRCRSRDRRRCGHAVVLYTQGLCKQEDVVHPRLEPLRSPVARRTRRCVGPSLDRSASSRKGERDAAPPGDPDAAPLRDRGVAASRRVHGLGTLDRAAGRRRRLRAVEADPRCSPVPMGAARRRGEHGRMSRNRTATGADVAVVGGGAVGVCIALELARRGASVVLIERGPELAWGCSAGNAGIVGSSHVVPLADPTAVRDGIRWMTRPDSPFFVRPRPRVLPWLSSGIARSCISWRCIAPRCTRAWMPRDWTLSTVGTAC